MSLKVQLTLSYDQSLDQQLKKKYPNLKDFRILAKSLDARGAPRGRKPKYHYSVELIQNGESFDESSELEHVSKTFSKRPLIIGAGPAGLFCALRLIDRGIACDIYERGDSARTRMKKIAKYWRYGELDPDTNVCYGEGGAGLYSDGKLITRVKSDYIQYVMEQFVRFGASEEVAYLANPHLGSNKIREIISRMTDYLKSKGCGVFYNSRVEKILFENEKAYGIKLGSGEQIQSDHIILASGHSARELYIELQKEKVSLDAKPFAIGVRIEHPRRLIDKLQHGEFCQKLDAARYRLSYHNHETDKGSYSFCMCPGGYVLSSGTDTDGIVTNGMSNSARNSPWSNSALVVSVNHEKDIPGDDPLRGLYYLEKIENQAFKMSSQFASGKELPAMTVKEFMMGQLDDKPLPKSSTPSKLVKVNLQEILPEFVIAHLKDALKEFDRKIPGFADPEAILIGPETRTSAPVTILRDSDSLESVSHSGLYPAGEGAGYAGGITSAAVDGVKIAEALLAK